MLKFITLQMEKTPDLNDKSYTSSIEMTQSGTIKAQAFDKGKATGKEFSKSFIVSKATGMSYDLNPRNTWTRADNFFSLTDGITGNTRTTAQWLSFGSDKAAEIVVDLQKVQQISHFSVGLLSAPAACGMYPPEIKVLVSINGVDYQQMASEVIKQRTAGVWEIYRPELIFPVCNARYVKLVAVNAGSCTALDGRTLYSLLMFDEVGVW